MVNEWIWLGRVKTLCPWALVNNESGSENGLGGGSRRVASDGAERDGSRWKSHGPRHLPTDIASCAVGAEAGPRVPLSYTARARANAVYNLRLKGNGHHSMGNACMDGRSRSLPRYLLDPRPPRFRDGRQVQAGGAGNCCAQYQQPTSPASAIPL